MAVIIDDAHPEISNESFAEAANRAYGQGMKASDIEGERVQGTEFQDWTDGKNLPSQDRRRAIMPQFAAFNEAF